jgi:TonB-linked SusC/RagA family outer membrane protein
MENLYKVSTKWKRLMLFMLFLVTHLSMAQGNINVSGKIISAEDQLGIPGVNILIKGTTNAVTTDFDGNFSISVPKNTVLQISSIGFKPVEVTASQPTLNVTLESDTKELQEVVVVGYGTQRKEAVTGSVASISGDNLREMPSPNITQALQGRLAGVEINQNNSSPGAAMQIRIRGVRSLTGSNNPLIVLDGIPFAGSISDINPDDIKSVDILKDASATAVYGSRGANGVILVTTRKGVVGQEAKFSYNTYYGLRNAIKYPMMNGPDFVRLRAAAGIYQTNGVDEANDVNTDWQDLFYKTGVTQNHNVNVTGGTQKGSYNFSTTYFKDEAVIPIQDYERITIFASLDQQIGEYFKVGFSSNSNYSITNGSAGLYGVLASSPIANPYNEDGTFKRVIGTAQDDSWVLTRGTLNALGDRYVNQTKAYGTYNSIYGEFKIPGVEGLKYRINLGGNLRMTFGGNYTGAGVFAVNALTESRANINHSINTSWTAENILSYDRTFGKHSVNALVLYSGQQDKFNSSSVTAIDIPADEFQFYNLGRAAGDYIIDPNNQAYTVRGLTSTMGRVMYSYDSRYLFSASYRRDGSSVLATNNRFTSYPAVSVGWNIAKESFMSNVQAINQLKVRVGYGRNANQAVNPYKTLGLLSARPYNYSDIYSTGYYISEAPNPVLGWEITTGWNYALDYGFFNDRISGSFEVYNNKTSDVLVGVGLPGSSGLNSFTANAANTLNRGIEFSINGLIIDNPNDRNGFRLEAGFNIYTNHNEITSLANGTTRNEGEGWFVGKPINSIYDYNRIGLWQEGDPYRAILEPGGNVGMIKVEYTGDYNADGTPTRAIGPADRKILDVNPDFQGGFNTNLSYKGFDLGIVGGFQSGGILVSTLYGSGGYLNMLTGRRGQVDVDYWTPENTDARYPKPGGILSGDNPKYGSTLGYFDASYVKIRTLTLGYNFTQDFVKKSGFDRLRLYATLQNALVLYSPYRRETGLDPEPNSTGDQNQAVAGYSARILTVGTNTPATRNLVFGLNVTF